MTAESVSTFKVQASLLPSVPVPVRVAWDEDNLLVLCVFSAEVIIDIPSTAQWVFRFNDTQYLAGVVSSTAAEKILLNVFLVGPDVGVDGLTYLRTIDSLVDVVDRPIAAFADFPIDTVIEPESATFSESTGDTVLTFNADVILCDNNKKPWTVRANITKQTVQTVTQTGANEITLTTNPDGPAEIGNFVSYDSSTGCLEDLDGARIGAVTNFPLTIIP